MKKILVFPLIVIIVLSCQNPTSSLEPTLGEEFELEFGNQITVPGEGIHLQFDDVLEDPRCPKDVNCVWAGNAKIAIQFNDHEATLNTHLEPKQTTISDFNIELISLSPHPVHQVDVEKEEYVAKFLITKN